LGFLRLTACFVPFAGLAFLSLSRCGLQGRVITTPLMADQPSWAETAASLLTRLSGGIELNCGFDQMELQVPNQQNPAGPPATWRLNGTLRIRTKGDAPGGLTIGAGAPKSSAPDAETPRG
jgi:hypothetical protein